VAVISDFNNKAAVQFMQTKKEGCGISACIRLMLMLYCCY